MWITLLLVCGKVMDNFGTHPCLPRCKKRLDGSSQIIHKVVNHLSTIIYARLIAFIHLSTYTTNTTI